MFFWKILLTWEVQSSNWDYQPNSLELMVSEPVQFSDLLFWTKGEKKWISWYLVTNSHYSEYNVWKLISRQCKLPPTPPPPPKKDNQLPLWLFKKSDKFLLSLQRVVLFVLFSLCWHHCKLVCEPAWPQQEVSCEPACFLLRIPLPGQKNRRYGLSHGVLALLLVVAAASHKWTIQWK